jgi:hypothetical protein
MWPIETIITMPLIVCYWNGGEILYLFEDSMLNVNIFNVIAGGQLTCGG